MKNTHSAPIEALPASASAALERMTCAELLEIIRLQYAIRDADAAHYDGLAASLRDILKAKLSAVEVHA